MRGQDVGSFKSDMTQSSEFSPGKQSFRRSEDSILFSCISSAYIVFRLAISKPWKRRQRLSFVLAATDSAIVHCGFQTLALLTQRNVRGRISLRQKSLMYT